ncbi:hypothetical protein ACROYT_G035696 [Oculina patagonica]
MPSFCRRYVDDTLARMPSTEAATEFLTTLNGLHPNLSFTMELPVNNKIPFIGMDIIMNKTRLETAVYRKPTNTGLLLHFHSHTDKRYKDCLIKTMVHRAHALSSTTEAFNEECNRLRSIFTRLDYPMHVINSTINNFVRNVSADTSQESETHRVIRVSLPFKDQTSANAVRRHLCDLSHKINVTVQPVFVSKKLEQDLKPKELKPAIVNHHCVVYSFSCNLCDADYVMHPGQNGSLNRTDCHYINQIEVRYWQLTINSAKYTKYYGGDFHNSYGKGSERKWCVDMTVRRDPPWLEFDLLYRRFISRIEVTLFDNDYFYLKSENLDVRSVRFSEDGVGWIGIQPNKKTPSGKISYVSRPVAARYVRIPTDKFPFRLTCVRLHLFGCSDEVQSLGLWSNQGRVKISWAEIYDQRSRNRNNLRFIEPGQSLYCTRAGEHEVYFRINMRQLFAISRIVFIGETKRDGTSSECVRDESRKLLSLFSSLDGKLWSPFGIYNQVHGDKIKQKFQIDYEAEFQCAAVWDIMPTIYGQHFWIREESDSRSIDCIAMEIFGNQAGSY